MENLNKEKLPRLHQFREDVRFFDRHHSKHRGIIDHRYGMPCLWALKDLKVNWDVLQAASSFWDGERHVFTFSSNDLTPTIEDFRALTGIETSREIAFPRDFCPLTTQLAEFLHLSEDRVSQA